MLEVTNQLEFVSYDIMTNAWDWAGEFWVLSRRPDLRLNHDLEKRMAPSPLHPASSFPKEVFNLCGNSKRKLSPCQSIKRIKSQDDTRFLFYYYYSFQGMSSPKSKVKNPGNSIHLLSIRPLCKLARRCLQVISNFLSM